MGANKHVCFACRKSINAPYSAPTPAPCPACGAARVVLPHRFRPPKQRQTEQWAAAQYLVEHGFRYQHLESKYFPAWATEGIYVRYPENLRAAKEFVEAYNLYPRQA